MNDIFKNYNNSFNKYGDVDQLLYQINDSCLECTNSINLDNLGS